MATTTKREPIKPSEVLLLSDFLVRANLGRGAWRTVCDRCEALGINIVNYVARQGYVKTDAWLEYLNQCDSVHSATRDRRQG